MAQTPFDKSLYLVSDWVAITPSDTVSPNYASRGLYVGGAGTVALVSQNGSVLTVTVGANTFLRDIIFVRVNATGTSATGLVALI